MGFFNVRKFDLFIWYIRLLFFWFSFVSPSIQRFYKTVVTFGFIICSISQITRFFFTITFFIFSKPYLLLSTPSFFLYMIRIVFSSCQWLSILISLSFSGLWNSHSFVWSYIFNLFNDFKFVSKRNTHLFDMVVFQF